MLCRFMMANRAAYRCTEETVTMGIMTGGASDHRAFDAPPLASAVPTPAPSATAIIAQVKMSFMRHTLSALLISVASPTRGPHFI